MTTAIAFDMYGTLADPSDHAALLQGYVPEQAQVAASWRRHQLEISWLLSLAERYEDFDAVTAYALDAALAEAQTPLPEATRRTLLDRARTPRLFDDVVPALEELALACLTLAVLSNGTREQLETIVRSTGIDGYFTELVSADEIGVFKPAPEVYLHAATRLARPIEEIWLVSGNPFDAAGAKLAGMRVAKLERSPSLSYGFAPPPDLIAQTLGELTRSIAASSAGAHRAAEAPGEMREDA